MGLDIKVVGVNDKSYSEENRSEIVVIRNGNMHNAFRKFEGKKIKRFIVQADLESANEIEYLIDFLKNIKPCLGS